MKNFICFASFLICSWTWTAPQKIDGLYVNTFGNRSDQPIVFIHGGPGFNSYDFELTTASALASEGFYVVVYDQRGQGRSEKAEESDFNYQTYANDLKSLISRLNLSSPILLAHSHGGAIAAKFDQIYPGVAQSIGLLSAPLNFWGTMKSLVDNCSRRYFENGREEAMKELTYLYYQLFLNPFPDLNKRPFVVSGLFGHGIQCGLYRTSVSTPDQVRLRKLLADNPIKGPLNGLWTAMPAFLKNENYIKGNYVNYVFSQKGRYFAIYGDEDGLFTPIELAVIKHSIQDSEGRSSFRLLKGASHSIFIDQQKKFIQAVKDFTE